MPDLCPHGDIAVACMECLDGPPAHVASNRAKAVADSPPFPSRYRGCCSVCIEWWDVDESIVHVTDGTYAHEDCVVRR